MRIQLLCDHKWRDLPNLSAIKIELEALGHRVLISTTKDAVALMQWFRPHCVVFNHLFGEVYRSLSRRLQEEGIAVVLLPTEGAMRPEYVSIAAGEFADFSACDLFLPWSEAGAELLKQRWGSGKGRISTVGCTRFDFYTPQFAHAVTEREQFCRQYGLNAAQPIVTWATQYGYAHLVNDRQGLEKLVREAMDVGLKECNQRIGLDVAQIPALHALGRDSTSRAFFYCAKALPDVQFVLRPHPVEDRNYYREQIKTNNLSNVFFCPSDYIWNVLKASDVHLHRQCTTAVEAWMWDKPTIEMGMDDVEVWRWPEREAGSDVVSDAEILLKTIREYLDGRTVGPAQRSLRKSYIRAWFGAADGFRCRTAAEVMDATLVARKKTWRRGIGGAAKSILRRDTLSAGLRYALSKRPNQKLLGRSGSAQKPISSGPEDKLITRRDVAAYRKLLGKAKSVPA